MARELSVCAGLYVEIWHWEHRHKVSTCHDEHKNAEAMAWVYEHETHWMESTKTSPPITNEDMRQRHSNCCAISGYQYGLINRGSYVYLFQHCRVCDSSVGWMWADVWVGDDSIWRMVGTFLSTWACRPQRCMTLSYWMGYVNKPQRGVHSHIQWGVGHGKEVMGWYMDHVLSCQLADASLGHSCSPIRTGGKWRQKYILRIGSVVSILTWRTIPSSKPKVVWNFFIAEVSIHIIHTFRGRPLISWSCSWWSLFICISYWRRYWGWGVSNTNII